MGNGIIVLMNLTFSLTIIMMTSNSTLAQKYIFYLHGAIVENQGANAVSPYFGAYDYNGILAAFRKEGFTVNSEVRQPNTNVATYGQKIADQINDLLKKGVRASDITVVGASKGAVIAMHVSGFAKNKELNFVFLAACNDGNFEAYPALQLYGNILSIYEKSDDIGESCIRFKEKSVATIVHYKEVQINTGLRHGFLFNPIPEWMQPAKAWAYGNYE